MTPIPRPACSRCRRVIADFQPPAGGVTFGYYLAEAWPKFANPGDVYICDACMWADPRYVAAYGVIHPPIKPGAAIQPIQSASPNSPKCFCKCHPGFGVDVNDPIGAVFACSFCTFAHPAVRGNSGKKDQPQADGDSRDSSPRKPNKYLPPRPWDRRRDLEDND